MRGVDLDQAMLECSRARHIRTGLEDPFLVDFRRIVDDIAVESAGDPPPPRVQHDRRGLETPLPHRGVHLDPGIVGHVVPADNLLSK